MLDDKRLRLREVVGVRRQERERAGAARHRAGRSRRPAAPREPGVSEAMRHLSLEPKRDESKTEPVPAGYTVVAAACSTSTRRGLRRRSWRNRSTTPRYRI